MSRGSFVAPALVCLFAFPAAGFSAVPSPTTSSVDVSIPTSPDGTLDFNVTVRDLANNPIQGSTVMVDFVNWYEMRARVMSTSA